MKENWEKEEKQGKQFYSLLFFIGLINMLFGLYLVYKTSLLPGAASTSELVLSFALIAGIFLAFIIFVRYRMNAEKIHNEYMRIRFNEYKQRKGTK